jgi:DNA gyrase/topoisomerase IV subunit A
LAPGVIEFGGILITPRKIDEWIREVEERPASAPEIIRRIASRLGELDRLNEQLRDENIQLRQGQKVEGYLRRIENLEYQLEMLKRQLSPVLAPEETIANLILFNSKGQILRIEVDFRDNRSQVEVGRFRQAFTRESSSPGLLIADDKEEALFLFDSGRVSTLPVAQIPKVGPGGLDWQDAFLIEPGIGEELANVLPSAKMSLSEFCVQASRRGFVRKIIESFFENHLSRGFIGSGVSLETDKTYGLVFGDRDDLFVMVSREGVAFSMDIARLPVTVEEAVKLAPSDRIIAVSTLRGKPSIVFVTQNGKVIHRETGWLNLENSLKTKGQAVISKARLETGVRIVGAAPVGSDDWGIFLLSDGQISALPLKDLLEKGSFFSESDYAEVLSFTVCDSQPVDPISG